MPNSKITLTFNSLPNPGETITIKDTLTGIFMTETFVAARSTIGETTIESIIKFQSYQFQNSFNADYNGLGLYSTVIGLVPISFVTITGVSPESQFSVITNTTAGAVSILIENEAAPSVFNFVSITVSDAGAPCDDVELTVQTSVESDNITFPISQPVTVNPFVFETLRAPSITLTMWDGFDSISQKLRIPKLLTAYIDLQVQNTLNGGNITVNRLPPLSDAGASDHLFPLLFTYSIDDINYYDSNAFSGLEAGSYIVYVKDNLGCKISIPFSIAVFSGTELEVDPIFEYPELNCIRMKKDLDWVNCGERKNTENTLSIEEDVEIPLCSYSQKWQQCDKPSMQIKSNYENISAFRVNSDLTETPLTVFKKTDNMGKTDVRDAYIVNYTSGEYLGKIGIYFGAGQTYDSLTLLQNGSYNTGNSVMSWIDVGEYLFIQGLGWMLVEAISPAPSGVSFAGDTVVLNFLSVNANLINNTQVLTSTQYNLVDFERYELEFDTATLQGKYQIKVLGTDSKTSYPDKAFLSELQEVSEVVSEPHYFVEYYNTINNEINFNTGIRFKLRIPKVYSLKWSPNSENDSYTTDRNTVLLDSRIREFYEFNAQPVPTAIGQLIVLAIQQNRLFIDGLNYLIEAEPSNKTFGGTNLNQVKATIVKSNYVFDTDSGKGGQEVVIPTGNQPLAIDGSSSGLLFVN
jgi:hypothetical protein